MLFDGGGPAGGREGGREVDVAQDALTLSGDSHVRLLIKSC